MSRVTFVTGYVPIEGHPRAAGEYDALGAELATARVRLRSFRGRLSDCWLHGMLADLPFEVTHSEGDNPAKNTLACHVVNHRKTAWLLEASIEDPESDPFVWVDKGIMHPPGGHRDARRELRPGARAESADRGHESRVLERGPGL